MPAKEEIISSFAKPAEEPFNWLRSRAYNKYSQWGEDGLLQAIFEKIGTENRFVIECGAGHPVAGSNSRKLIEEGWHAVLVEPDEKLRNLLLGEYGGNESVQITPYAAAARTDFMRSDLGFGLDDILMQNDAPADPDLLVIDVDGQDWYLWNGLLHHRPRVVVIEFGGDSEPDFIPAEYGEGQAGREAIEKLATMKGYEPVVLTGFNLICVDRTLLPRLGPGADCYVNEPIAEPGKILFDPSTIGAIMAAPRIAFLDNMFCCFQLAAAGIHMERGGGAFWDQCLTRLMQNALDAGRQYILTLDYDSVFTLQDVIELYRILASPGGENIDAIAPMQIRREKEGVLLTVAGEGGKNRAMIERDVLSQIAMPVRTAHFGLTLLRADSLRKMKKPWLHSVPDKDGEWGEGRLDADINFWENWRGCGNTIYSANHVVIGHMEQVCSWPDDNLKKFFQPMTDYQENGKPPQVWK